MKPSNKSTLPAVALKAPRTSLGLIMFGKSVHDAMLNNPNFPSPTPSLSVLAAHINEFEEAETKAASRTKGATAFRDAKKKRLEDDLSQLKAYVQSLVSDDMSPTEAVALVESAFMSVKKTTARPRPEVQAKNADVSGKVVLAAKAVAPSAVYCWEYSVDQSKWTPVPETMRARTELSGLTPACLYYFRFRAITRAGWQDYSHVVSLVVR